MHLKQHQSGFTLVEIAIVLVIIGLLLGSVLKGQELITTAKVRSLADQGSAVRTAFFAFQDRFRAYPGDFVTATTSLPAGIGTVANGSGNSQVDSAPEQGQVWLHLSRAGFLTGTYDGIAANNNLNCATSTCPSNLYGGRMTFFYDSNANGTTALAHEIRTGSQIPVGVIAELDLKVDDGAPNAGTFQFDAGSAVSCISPAGSVLLTAVWDVSSTSAQTNCAGVYRL